MDRSPGFGSIACDLFALFRLGFPSAPYLLVLNLATYHNSPDRSTKSTLSSFNALQLLVNTGFQVLFHSPPGVLFTFPSRYFSTIGHQLVFSLGRWSSLLPTRFLVPRGTLDPGLSSHLSHTGLLPSVVCTFQCLILLNAPIFSPVLNPAIHSCIAVWAPPLSLATTYGISFDFFSCRYLDVSVPYVSPMYAMFSHTCTWAFTPGGFPHSDICGSLAICASPQLFAAYHVLHRLLVPRHSPCALISLTSIPLGISGSLQVIVFLTIL